MLQIDLGKKILWQRLLGLTEYKRAENTRISIFKNLCFSYLWRSLQQEASMRRLRFIKT